MTRTPAKMVSRKKAEAALDAVRGLYPPNMEFALFTARHEGLARGCWSITAEGAHSEPDWTREVAESSRYERNLLREMGGFSMCPPTFPDVVLEPLASGALGVYPEPAEETTETAFDDSIVEHS